MGQINGKYILNKVSFTFLQTSTRIYFMTLTFRMMDIISLTCVWL